MNEQYQELKKVIPVNPKLLLNNCSVHATSIREKIIINQRILCLFPLNDNTNYPSFFPLDRDKFYTHISQDIELLRDSIAPQQVQFISKAYDFFLQNPIDIVNVILSVEKTEKSLLPFLAFSTIPSFFGFFASFEYLSLAFSFYCALISKASQPIVKLFLRPFFCNATTIRYIEVLSEDVFKFFCQDDRLSSSEGSAYEHLIMEHSKTFLDCILMRLKFLPDIHLKVLHFMHTFQWSSVNIMRYFLNHFIFPQLFLYMKNMSILTHENDFRKMATTLYERVTEKQLTRMFKTSSIFEIPPAFNDFGLPYLNFLLTPLDCAIFYEVARPILNVPKILIMLQSPKFLGRQQLYAPIWIRVFPKAPTPVLYSATWRNLIFQRHENIERPSFNIPLFQRRFRMIQMIAHDMGTAVDPFDLIDGTVKFASSHIIQSSLKETSVDITGICEDCFNYVSNYSSFLSTNMLCEKCKKIISERKEISFYDYALNISLFKMQKKAVLFEKMLVEKFATDRLEKWLELVECALECATISVANRIMMPQFTSGHIGRLFKNNITPNNILSKYSPLLFSRTCQQLFYCIKAEILLDFFQKNNSNLSKRFLLQKKKLESEWTKIQNSAIIVPTSINFLNTRSNIGLTMNKIGTIPFHFRYFRIMECLKIFERVRKMNKWETSFFEFIFHFCTDPSYILSTIEISAMLMKMPEFLPLCSKKETIIWYRFEEDLQTFLKTSDKLSDLYNDFHDCILQLFCQTV